MGWRTHAWRLSGDQCHLGHQNRSAWGFISLVPSSLNQLGVS